MDEIKNLQSLLERKEADLTAAIKSRIEAEENRRVMSENCIGCLNAVKAMLQNSSYGITHRQRNFYGEAIVKFIDNTISSLSLKDEIPF